MSNVVAFDPNRRRGNHPRPAQTAAPAQTCGVPLMRLWESWELALLQADKSPYTIKNYGQLVSYFNTWLIDNGFPADSEGVTADHCRRYLLTEKERTSPASAATRHQQLRAFWKWVVDEGHRETSSPMTNVAQISVPDKLRTFFTVEQERKMLDACAGRSFIDRRDTAILRIFMDVGVRVSGMAGIHYIPDDDDRTDVFLRERKLRIRLKGGNEHWIPLGKKSAVALDRYLIERAKHEHAGSEWLWLGAAGRRGARLSDSGIRRLVRARGDQAGVQGAHPHRFRRTFAHEYLAGGGDVDGLMAIAGWSSYRMPQIYAGDLAGERAREAHKKLSPGDRI